MGLGWWVDRDGVCIKNFSCCEYKRNFSFWESAVLATMYRYF